MFNEQHYVHSAREPLLPLLQYSRFSQTPSLCNMASRWTPITHLKTSLTIIFNKLIPNSIHIVGMALKL